MVKIYFQNKPLLLVPNEEQAQEYLNRPTTIFIDDFNPAAINTMIQEMQLEDYEAGVFVHKDIKELLLAFKKKLTVITAAGGLVKTPQNKMLFIYRRGKWDLPKGKLDEDETIEECALREVQEETGLKGATIDQMLSITYHSFYQQSELILKETHWFLMTANEQDLTPQKNEDIEECKWVSIDELPHYLSGTYQLVHDVVNKGLEVL